MKEEEKTEEAAEEEAPVVDIEAKEEVTFDDFMKMQFQVGEIIACEEVGQQKTCFCFPVKMGSPVKQNYQELNPTTNRKTWLAKRLWF